MRKGTIAAAALLSAVVTAGVMSTQAFAAYPQRLQVSNVTASSTLPDEPGYSYDVWNIVDHDPTTCWTEGVDGDGIGEYIDIYIPAGTTVTGALVYPGYYRDQTIFDKNGAPSMLTFSSGGKDIVQWMTPYATTFQDGFEGCYFNLTEPIVSDGKVRVKIGKVRAGWKYQDTCISELYLYGYGSGVTVDTESIVPGSASNNGSNNGTYSGANNGSNNGTNAGKAGIDSISGVDPDTGDPYEYYVGDEVVGSEIEDFSGLCKNLLMLTWDGEGQYSLKANQLTSSQRALALYWYQYNCEDERVTREDMTNRISYRGASAILKDLFGSNVSTEEDLRVFQDNYVDYYDGSVYTVPSVGDFGDAGEWYLDEPEYEGTYDGSMVLSGRVMKYDSTSNEYKAGEKYMMYFSEEGTNSSGYATLYQFREIDIL